MPIATTRTRASEFAFKRAVVTVLLLLAIVSLTCVAVATHAWISRPPMIVHLPAPAAAVPPAPEAIQSRQGYEEIRVKLEYAEKQLGSIRDMAAALVTIAAIFAAVLGVTAYINLKQVVETGKEELNRLSEYREMIRAEFPALGDMDAALTSILSRSLAVLRIRTDDWRTLYASLDERAKQQVALAEITAGAFDFFSLEKVTAYSHEASDVYHRLGRFYGSKYVARGEDGFAGDRFRAILYFETALYYQKEPGRRRAEMLADIGLMHLQESYFVSEQKAKRAEAEKWFTKSLLDQETQPAALLALAWIERRDRSLDEAIARLTTLIEAADPNDPESRRFVYKAYFNRACYRCLRKPSGWQDLVLQDLNRSKSLVHDREWDQWVQDLSRELEGTEDLADFATERETAAAHLKMRSTDRDRVAKH